MKIECSKKEFAQFIRDCERITAGTNCDKCVMLDVCGEERPEDVIEFELTGDA